MLEQALSRSALGVARPSAAGRRQIRRAQPTRAQAVATREQNVVEATAWIDKWRSKTGGEGGAAGQKRAPAPAAAADGFDASQMSVLAEALAVAGLSGVLSGSAVYTVFAPTDAAFGAALESLKLTKAQLLALPNLGDILKHHVVSGKVMAGDLTQGMRAPTLQGASLTIDLVGGAKVNGAKVLQADVVSSNGVIHVIDAVLLPPAAAPGALYDDGKAEDSGAGISAQMKAKLRDEYLGLGGSPNTPLQSNSFLNIILFVLALVAAAYLSGGIGDSPSPSDMMGY